MTYLGAQASAFFKKASSRGDIVLIITSVDLYIGGILYVVAALLNIYVLSVMEYSKVLPLTSITYLWTMLLSYLIFKEKIRSLKLFGVMLIIVGAALVVL